MIFVSRDRPRSTRFVYVRVGLLFAAVILWMAGVRLGSDLLIMIAMAVVVVGIAIGIAGRRSPAGTAAGREEEGDSGVEA